MRVLAADDNEPALRALGRWLTLWGYEPELAHDGEAAWLALKRPDAPSVVVLDWDMPGLTGPEICRLLRSTPHGTDTYVLILTAKSDKDDLVRALEAGADDFLSKPFDERELKLRLAKGARLVPHAAAPPSEAPPSAGEAVTAGATLVSKYRLEERIARGGMGSIWRAAHLALGIPVAIKFMAPHLLGSAEYASFEREARAAAQLRGEHTVRVYDHGLSESGEPFLVMEYLQGESLAARIARAKRLPTADVVSTVQQTALALAEAHELGIVHRDVKTENVHLLDESTSARALHVKLLDFGLARSRESRLVESGLVGTPCAMSPEYIRGDCPADALLDLWGLAVVAYEALIGVSPFDGPTIRAVYERLCHDPLPVPSQAYRAVTFGRGAPAFPAGFDAWFALACHRTRSMRFQTALEFSTTLAAALGMAGETVRSAAAQR